MILNLTSLRISTKLEVYLIGALVAAITYAASNAAGTFAPHVAGVIVFCAAVLLPSLNQVKDGLAAGGTNEAKLWRAAAIAVVVAIVSAAQHGTLPLPVSLDPQSASVIQLLASFLATTAMHALGSAAPNADPAAAGN